MRLPTNHNGFTIVEMMIAITVIAVLTALAIPSLTQFLARNELAGTTNALISGISLARSEAITRSNRVAICPSSNASTCNSGRWQDGWLVFIDDNANNVRNGGETILQAENGAPDSTVTVASTANLADGFSFNANGALADFAIADTGSISLTHGDITPGTQLNISFTGQLTTTEIVD